MIIKNIEIVQPLEDVLSQLRVELHVEGIKLLEKDPRESGNNIQIQCPYHSAGQERKPSMGIRKDTGICHCFTCDTTVGLDEFISNCFGYNDSGAFGWNWLLKNFVSLEVENRHYEMPNNSEEDISYVSEEELDSYRYYNEYWDERGITDKDLIERFDLGYSFDEEMITMPDRDIHGNCLFVAKRSVNYKYFNYPAGAKKNCYGIYELYQLDEFPKEVWITESMIDALRLWQVGKFACALNGLGNQQQIRELLAMPCRTFILATDMDEAGQKARDRLYFRLRNRKILYEVFLPDGRKDIGECTDEEIISLVPSIL